MKHKQSTRLHVMPHTRLETVWRVVLPDGRVQWEVWTAVKDRNAPFHGMQGTNLTLHDDGSVTRVTINPDMTDRVIEVMPMYGEE